MLESLGPYELKDPLGHGGMGTVFLGVHGDTRQRVAIKVLAPAYASDDGFRDRFKAEIASLEQLRHPGIVELFGYGEENGTLYYVMELVDGSNLQTELSEGCRFSWREAIDFGVAICSALKHAHDHGIIHRDIKPANLLLSKDNQVKLSDFGIAKLFGNTQITSDGGVVGTADYMAPEQAEGIGATVRSDLYSIGGVLYCLLAGRPPFQGKSVAEVVHKVRYEPAIPVRRFAPDTPEELEVVIDKLLSKNPRDRVPTARALSNRLKAIRHALSLNIHPEVDPGFLDMGDDASSAAGRSGGLSSEEFADLETVVEQAPNPEDEVGGNNAPQDDPFGGAGANGRRSAVGVGIEATDASRSAEPRTHFTQVNEAHRRRRLLSNDEPPEAFWHKIVQVSGLLITMLLLVLIVWRLRQPATADQLYARIQEVLLDDPAAPKRVENEVLEFLERFPEDPRCEDVAAVQGDIDMERLARQLSTRARNRRHPLAPVEQALVEAIQIESLNPVAARKKLIALIAVFSTDSEASDVEKKCILLARRRLDALNLRIAQSGSSTVVNVLNSRIESALRIAPSNPKESMSILRGIIELYYDKPWANETVTRAREELKRLEGRAAPPPSTQ